VAAAGSVVVFGSSRVPAGSPVHADALALGRALATRGVEVRCGGYGGVMEAVARGAREAGGRVVGCTLAWPGESRDPNPWLTEVIPNASLDARVAALLRGTRAAIALHGGVGTLNELLWTWTLLLHGVEAHRRLVLLGPAYAELMEFLASRFEVDRRTRSLVRVAASVGEAVALACDGGPGA
jgi:hypothetical protein